MQSRHDLKVPSKSARSAPSELVSRTLILAVYLGPAKQNEYGLYSSSSMHEHDLLRSDKGNLK